MRIDAHQHFLEHGRFEYPALPPPLDQTYLPEHSARILRRNHFDGLVAIGLTESVEETRWLLELASRNEIIRGVVGWVCLDDSRTLDDLQRNPKLKGVRIDAANLTTEGLAELAQRRLACELRLGSSGLGSILRIGAVAPLPHIVIEHLGEPRIRETAFEQWANGMEQLAQLPAVYVKLAGLLTLAVPPATVAELQPYFRHLLGTFGPGRLMFGSDWPFCLTVADLWKATLATFTQALGAQTIEVRSKLLGEAAEKCYRLA